MTVYTPAALAREWRVVPGFPSYRINGQGELISLLRHHKNTPGKLMRQQVRMGGYKRVTLFNGSVASRKDVFVHRLVLAAFIGPQPAGTVSAHLDGNPANNHANNLAWVSQKENMAHREAHGNTPRGFSHWETKFTEAQVAEIRTLLLTNSIRAVASRFNVHHSTIWRLKVGITFA